MAFDVIYDVLVDPAGQIAISLYGTSFIAFLRFGFSQEAHRAPVSISSPGYDGRHLQAEVAAVGAHVVGPIV